MPTTLPEAWRDWLAAETSQDYWRELHAFLDKELTAGKTIYPPRPRWYAALEAVAPAEVKVVILGQDPYHGPGQAHGLSFSVPAGVALPPSLRNIFKEISQEFGKAPQSGDLSNWAKQGVLLLNSVLTVEAGRAGSHQKRGWERFTNALIARLALEREGVVFMLWGAYAEAKATLIDPARHLVLRSPHPSPLSAHRGFFGNGHFAAANAYLAEHGVEPIDWTGV
ncbi:uracil-DNA glycosylase [Chitinimonas lacunae]|uniref:Uracil-DNA glycosylase n=1 Tax=Chitinimonas lacunae TaxID=1963018 RepID=A0ABV8MW28_9NEIS